MKFSAEISTIDKHALGRAVLDYSDWCLKRAMASIDKAEKTLKIIHVRYADSIKRPKEMCRLVMEKVTPQYLFLILPSLTLFTSLFRLSFRSHKNMRRGWRNTLTRTLAREPR
jgi:hypothetical protein